LSEKTFYITTPIYYPSGKLHLGSSYTTIACDVMSRYKRLMGYETLYLTGLDEHGMKIQRKAEEAGLSPQDYLDPMAQDVKELWKKLDISYDIFMRTTDDYHKKAVQQAFETLLAKDDIYLGKYAGWYSVSDEEFFTETQLEEVYRDDKGMVIGGLAPSGHEVEWVEEETYFFRMSKYADWLLEYYEAHPNFIQPEIRKNEMINNFIKPGLEDLALTRTSFTHGIPVLSNPKHVIYVWFDALLNYITALGFNGEDDSNFKKFWPGVNMVGKEIVRFHTIYWPIMLHALGFEPPVQVFGHGWLLMKDGKMSKSKGNVVYPDMLLERYGLDAVRYYLMRAISFGADGIFTPEDFVGRINYDLANDLGNLLNRSVSMINKYFDGEVPTFKSGVTPFDEMLENFAADVIHDYHQAVDKMEFNIVLETVWKLISRANKYIDETAPWVLAKDEANKEQLGSVMSHLVESLRVVAELLQPFMTQSPVEIFRQLGLEGFQVGLEELTFGNLPTGLKVVAKGTPIFPRLDLEEEVAYIKEQMSGGVVEEVEEVWNPEETKLNSVKEKQIKFDTFDAVELKVAEVIEVKKVEVADKLLQFRLDAGDEADRQILSGIAEFYPNFEELIGEKLVIVANLKPRKMRGQVSQGMILSAEHDGKLTVVKAPKNMPNGSVIG
jgi:methionyl-tRNA synthetase